MNTKEKICKNLLEVRKRAIDPIQGKPPQNQSKITYQNQINLAQEFHLSEDKLQLLCTTFGKLFQTSSPDIVFFNFKPSKRLSV